MESVIIYALISGIVGTTIGGIIAVYLAKNDKIIGILFCIASGIMLSLVCFDLIPETFYLCNKNILSLLLSLLAGGIFVALVNEINGFNKNNLTILSKTMPKKDMLKVGICMLIVITLHNLPEGVVIGGSHTENKGILTAVLIGLHNIPEGIAVSAPLVFVGVKKYKAILFSFVAGMPTLIGAIIGYYVGMQSKTMLAICLGIASGAMLNLVFSDILPEAQKMTDSKITGYATFLSTIFGVVLIYLFI